MNCCYVLHLCDKVEFTCWLLRTSWLDDEPNGTTTVRFRNGDMYYTRYENGVEDKSVPGLYVWSNGTAFQGVISHEYWHINVHVILCTRRLFYL